MRRTRSLLIMAGIAAGILAVNLLYVRHNLDSLIDRGFAGLRARLAPASLEIGTVRAPSWKEIEMPSIRLTGRPGEEIFSARMVSARLTLGALLGGRAKEITVEGATLRLERDKDGRWNLPLGGGDGKSEGLGVGREGGSRAGGLPAQRVRLRNVTISIVDDLLFPPGTEHNIWVRDLTISSASGGRYRIRRGDLDVEHLGRVRLFDLEWSPREGTLSGTVGVEEIQVEEALRGRLPLGEVEGLWERFRPAGRVALDADVEIDLGAGEPVRALRATARLSGVRIRCEDFPHPIEDLAGTLRLNGDRLDVDLSGSFGDGDLERLEGRVESIWSDPTMSLHAEIHEVVANESLRNALDAAGIGEVIDEFDPSGSFRMAMIDLVRSRAGEEVKLTVSLMPRRIDIAYAGFPYRIEKIGSGVLRLDVSFPPGVVPGEEPIKVTLEALRGRHGSGRILGEGTWERTAAGVGVDLRFLAKEVDLGPDVGAAIDSLGEETAREWRTFSPSGPADVRVSLRKAPGEEGLEFEVETEFLGCSVRPAEVPYPLEDFRGRLRLTREGFTLEDGRARHGKGSFEAEGSGVIGKGDHTARFHVNAYDVPLDVHFPRFLTEEALRVYDRFAPRGSVNGEIDLVKRAGSRGVEVEAAVIRPQGVEIRYEGFPYPVRNLQGQVTIRDGKVQPTLVAEFAGGGEGFLRGEIGNGEDGRDVDLRFSARGLSLDDTLRWAIPPGQREIWDMLAPGGKVDGDARIGQIAGGDFTVDGEARLAGASCRPTDFPMRVWGLRGPVPFDLTIDPEGKVSGALTLGGAGGGVPIEGERGRTRVSVTGGIVLGEAEPDISLRVTARDLEIGPTLRGAIPEGTRERFDEFQPEGWADVDATVRREPGGETRVDWAATLAGVSVRYRPFPFPVEDAEGVVSMRDGVLRIEEMRGRGAYGEANVVVNGESLREGEVITLWIEAERVPLIEEVRVLLPESLARTWRDLALEGETDVDLRLFRDPESLLILGEARARDLEIRFGQEGLRFKGMSGRFQASGKVHKAGPQKGRVDVEGHLLDVAGFYRERPIDNLQAHLSYRRAAGEDAPGVLKYDKIRGGFVGGRLNGAIDLVLGKDVEYEGELHLKKGRLEKVLAPLEESSAATGEISADLVFRGKGGDPESLEGEGEVRVRGGDIIKIPAVSGLLERLGAQGTFATMDIDLELGAKEIDTSFTLKSKVLSVFGSGTVGYDGILDFNATHEIGPPWFHSIPGFGWLWDLLKGNILGATVRGTLEDPVVETKLFPYGSEWLE